MTDVPWDHTWLHDEPIGRMNFDGKVNKKSDGRDPRTGSYPSPTDPNRMKKYRHNVIVILDYNVQQVYGDETLYYGKNDMQVARVKPELKTCSECNCKIKLKDMRRGDVVCPQCGLMKGRVQIHQQTSRGGSDDVEYGGN